MFWSRRSSPVNQPDQARSRLTSSRAPQRSLLLHLGLAKTGTTFVQRQLAEHRPALRDAGTIYPFTWPEGMFHAAVDVVAQHDEWAIPQDRRQGAWDALVAQAESFDGAALISHEILALASAEQARSALARLTTYDVGLVVTVRDLARQLPAYWQEEVKNGSTLSFAELADSVLGPRETPGTAGAKFWHGQDVLAVLDRWSETVAPDNIHVVTCPPAGAAPEVLWERFAGATGIPTLPVPPERGRSNPSLGCAQIQLLRTVNRDLGPSLTREQHIHVVKRRFAQKILSSTEPFRAPRTPPELAEPLQKVAEHWQEEIRARGYVVHGDLADLAPVTFATDGRHPDDVSEAESAALGPAAAIGLLETLVADHGHG